MKFLLLALVGAKIIDLIADPYFQNPECWTVDPRSLLNSSKVPGVGPAVENGRYTYCANTRASSSCGISTLVDLPEQDLLLNLTVAVQVGGGGAFSLQASFQDLWWIWSATQLAEIAVGHYANVSVLINSVSNSGSLKLTFDSLDKPDFISVNEIHLFTETKDPISVFPIVIAVLAALFLISILFWVFRCYRSNLVKQRGWRQ